MTTIVRRAARLVTFRFLLYQLGLAAAVLPLVVVWLRMPDASGLEVAASCVLVLLIALIALGGEAVLLLWLRGCRPLRGAVLRGAIFMAIAMLAWFAWSALIDQQSLLDGLRAGYVNSQLSQSQRHLFTFPHLMLGLGWLWAGLRWIGTGVLLAFAVAGTQSARPLRGFGRVAGSLTYWLTLGISALLGSQLTQRLAQWTPGHGLAAEVASLTLRLGTAVIFDLTLTCAVLATITALVAASENDAVIPGGTPLPSQPRTTDAPK